MSHKWSSSHNNTYENFILFCIYILEMIVDFDMFVNGYTNIISLGGMIIIFSEIKIYEQHTYLFIRMNHVKMY